MNKTKAAACGIMALVAVCCAIMAYVETVIEPAYAVKSGIKAAVFLVLPVIFSKAAGIGRIGRPFKPDGKRVLRLLLPGFCVYAIILGAYALTRGVFDYAALVRSLSADQKVAGGSFLWVALYISFCNSFLEEFLFRLVSFILLSKYTAPITAYAFSSLAFAIYHLAMIGSSFPPPLLVLALAGLAVGGAIFDCADRKEGTMLPSWVIHMFADLAIMTIWYIYL